MIIKSLSPTHMRCFYVVGGQEKYCSLLVLSFGGENRSYDTLRLRSTRESESTVVPSRLLPYASFVIISISLCSTAVPACSAVPLLGAVGVKQTF